MFPFYNVDFANIIVTCLITIFFSIATPCSGELNRAEKKILKEAYDGKLSSQLKIGDLYLKKKIFKEAGYWFLHAARRGNPYAQFRIAQLYDLGPVGIKRNFKNAIHWYELSDLNGFKRATRRLNYLKMGDNRNTKADRVKPGARKVPQREETLSENRAKLLSDVQEGKKILSAEQLREFAFVVIQWGKKYHSRGIALLEEAGQRRDLKSYSKLGQLYNSGNIHTKKTGTLVLNNFKNIKKAIHWYKKAAQAGDPVAQLNLALLYEDGVGVQPDYRAALSWYIKVVENKDPAISSVTLGSALTAIGFYYLLGKGGLKKSTEKGHYYIMKAALMGHKPAITVMKKLDQGRR
ncbi:tetratricopeptide repeat protein [Candidatus Riflebacteria bacterium]